MGSSTQTTLKQGRTMTDNLLLQHILTKSKYTNLKEFARACFIYLTQANVDNWSSVQCLYVRLRDNLIGECETMFHTKSHETRNFQLITAIGDLLSIHPDKVIHLATIKFDKQQMINNLQDQIDEPERQFHECSIHDQKQQIEILMQMIQHLNLQDFR